MTIRHFEGPLFSQGPVVIFRWAMDEGWPVEFVIGNIADLFGQTAERFISGEVAYAEVIHPDDLATVSREVLDGLRNGPDTFQHQDYRIVRPDGSVRWIQAFTVFERDTEGRARYANGYIVDITPRKEAQAELLKAHEGLEARVAERTAALTREIEERRQAEVELERRDVIQRLLTDVTIRLFADDDWTAIIDDVLAAIGEAVGTDRVHVYENQTTAKGEAVTSLRHEWTAAGVAGQIDNPLIQEQALDSPPFRRWAEVLARGEAQLTSFDKLPENERRLAAALDVRSILLVPIFVGETWWGGIALVDSRNERSWSETDVRALTVVAGALGVAIRRSRDEKALRASEQRLAGVVESLQEQIALFDADDRLALCNEAFRRYNPMADQAIRERWTFEDLLWANVRRGFLLEGVGREEEFVRERMICHRHPSGPILRSLADGTACLVRESPTSEGGIAVTFVDVTDLQWANAALQAAKSEAETTKALLQDALESTTEAFALYDAEGRLVVFNEAYRRLYKHFPDFLEVGASFEELLRERARRGMVSDIGGDPEEWMRRRLETFFRASGSLERIFPDGSWWKVNEQRTAHGGIAQIATDITEIKAREEALRESEELFRALFERTRVGAATTGLDFRYHTVNRAFCDLVGYTRDELLTMTPLDITHPGDVDRSRQTLASLAGGEVDTKTEEKRYVRKDGQIVWAVVSTSLIRDAAGAPAYAVRHVQDITERRRAQDAALRLRGELAHVARVRTMGEMATGFAHELNQPLAAIVNYAQGCLRRQRSGAIGTDEFAHVMELIAGQGQRAGNIIRRIRRFVRQDPSEVGPIDINAAIRETLDFIGNDALHNQVEIDLHLGDNLPAVEGDGVQFQQVILNLARNAIEAIRESATHGGRVDVSTRRLSDGVEVLVVDSGPGIDESVARHAFDPFFTTRAQGMGMGLPICRSIVEFLGGSLTLEDRMPGQTTFRILLKSATQPKAEPLQLPTAKV